MTTKQDTHSIATSGAARMYIVVDTSSGLHYRVDVKAGERIEDKLARFNAAGALPRMVPVYCGDTL